MKKKKLSITVLLTSLLLSPQEKSNVENVIKLLGLKSPHGFNEAIKSVDNVYACSNATEPKADKLKVKVNQYSPFWYKATSTSLKKSQTSKNSKN